MSSNEINEIQSYRILTSEALASGWRTPRERALELEVKRLKAMLPSPDFLRRAREIAIREWRWPADITLADFVSTLIYKTFKNLGYSLD